MFMNANMIRHLSNTLRSLKLKDIDGENVAKLGERVTQLACEIKGSGHPPSDLINLVSRPYTTVQDLSTCSRHSFPSYDRYLLTFLG